MSAPHLLEQQTAIAVTSKVQVVRLSDIKPPSDNWPLSYTMSAKALREAPRDVRFRSSICRITLTRTIAVGDRQTGRGPHSPTLHGGRCSRDWSSNPE